MWHGEDVSYWGVKALCSVIKYFYGKHYHFAFGMTLMFVLISTSNFFQVFRLIPKLWSCKGKMIEDHLFFFRILTHWTISLWIYFPCHSDFSGSRSQNCLWNTIIGGLTGNLKERPKLTIINDPRPPEEILADELLPIDSPEALVKTSFRSDWYEFTSFIFERMSF